MICKTFLTLLTFMTENIQKAKINTKIVNVTAKTEINKLFRD